MAFGRVFFRLVTKTAESGKIMIRQPDVAQSDNPKSADGNRNRRLRIAYVTMDDPNDRRSWSGTRYYMAQALEKHCGDVVRVGPLKPASLSVGNAIRRGVRLITGKRYLHMATTSFSKTLGEMTRKRLTGEACDVIFAPAGSGIVANLHTQIPLVYLSDATFQLMLNYNKDFSNVLPSHIRMADEIERLAIEKASRLIYPSSWAAQSAVRDYGADPSKVDIIPFGANFDNSPSREEALRPREEDRYRLLFVGVNWEQKGGEIAFEALLELERLGIQCELTIVGCRPPRNISHPHLRVFPFLNKNDASEREQLTLLYREATFFILPTRAECFSIALCEANAYGIPILATRTGGLPELVRDGVNGFLFPLEARGNHYAARISEVYGNSGAYQALRASSREQFESRLNWDAWAERVKNVLWAAVASPVHEKLTSSKASGTSTQAGRA
jgi:glycosyltransferase involved in cell wall biosynthesis